MSMHSYLGVLTQRSQLEQSTLRRRRLREPGVPLWGDYYGILYCCILSYIAVYYIILLSLMLYSEF